MVSAAAYTFNPGTRGIWTSFTSPATFSKITAEQEGALPVNLISFDLKRIESQTILNWETSGEANSDYFEILHSTNAVQWNSLGKVAAAGVIKQ